MPICHCLVRWVPYFALLSLVACSSHDPNETQQVGGAPTTGGAPGSNPLAGGGKPIQATGGSSAISPTGGTSLLPTGGVAGAAGAAVTGGSSTLLVTSTNSPYAGGASAAGAGTFNTGGKPIQTGGSAGSGGLPFTGGTSSSGGVSTIAGNSSFVSIPPGGSSTGGSSSWPTEPPARICDNATLLSGPATAPTDSIVVPAGDNSKFDFSRAGKTYWFATGVHTLGSNEFSQIGATTGTTYIGAPGAIIDGSRKNRYAFTGTPKNVTLRYLTIQNFVAPQDEGVVNHDSGDGWTIEYCTVKDNAGAGLMIGSQNTLRYNCIEDNGQYGFNAFKCADWSGDSVASCANQGSGTGTRIQHIVMEYNEIAGNNRDDHETKSPGCGCTGGGKFWDVEGAIVRSNWVHDNKSVGLWADTNNRDFLFEGNYIADNDAEGIFYEISYNARIVHNTLVRNMLNVGKNGDQGFPNPAIYLSESGGDPIAGGQYTTLSVVENYFEDNWNGIAIWENADRYCASPNNTSSDYCTLYFGAGYDLSKCGQSEIGSNLDQCRWKSKNILVEGNVFKIDRARIGCTSGYTCGMNGLFSNYGTSPSWSPYQDDKICQAITFDQNNVFRNNSYVGDWSFMPFTFDHIVKWNAWRAAPYGQDAGSTMTPN